MRKIIVTLSLSLATTLAVAQDLPPAQALPICAGVYGTLAAYAAPEYKAAIKSRSIQIMNEALKYNANSYDIAATLMQKNIAKVKANDPAVGSEVANAELYCRTYVKQYGL